MSQHQPVKGHPSSLYKKPKFQAEDEEAYDAVGIPLKGGKSQAGKESSTSKKTG